MILSDFLKTVKTDYPSLSKNDIELIISEVLSLPRPELILKQGRELTKAEIAQIDLMLFSRAEHEPLQYIFGKTCFRHLDLEVGEGVLIPRPETEVLVDLAIKLIRSISAPEICDLGTGSGAIALALASEITESSVKGIDISRDALKYAEKNKLLNKIGNADFIYGELFSPFEKLGIPRKFHLITANLPYVSDELMKTLPREIREFEPELALSGGEDGLDIIRTTAEKAKLHLYPGGAIIFEFSPEQQAKMVEILSENGYTDIKIEDDLTNRARFATARLP